jgi:hypothetical protein
MGSQEKLQQHKESSKIMQENSTNDYTKQIQTQKQSKETDPSQQVIMCVANASSQTQPTTNEAVTAFSKIHCEKVTLKFVKLWLKFSERTDRGGASHKKCMNLYLWRLNALYDESSKRKMEKLLSWPAKIERLGEFPPFEYVFPPLCRKSSPSESGSTSNCSSTTNVRTSREPRFSRISALSSRIRTVESGLQSTSPSKSTGAMPR